MATVKATVKAIYTDGACSGNPGPGGWGTRIEFTDDQVHELGGRHIATTNNRMEMQAAIEALDFLKEANISNTAQTSITLHTDSQYLIKGITQWIKGWKRKGWKNSAGKPVLNKDLWKELDQLTQGLAADKLSIDWHYVKGHAGNPGNERCDEIARAYSHNSPISLKQYRTSAQSAKSKSALPESTNTELDQSSANIKPPKTNQVSSDTLQESDAKTQVNPAKSDANAGHRKDSLDTPEINAVIETDASQTPALRFYDDTAQEETDSMSAATQKNHDKNQAYPEASRIERLQNTLKTLQVTDELAKQGYLITSAELADLMDVNASAVTSRGDYWAWRNWTVSRIRREGNQILWQLERIDE